MIQVQDLAAGYGKSTILSHVTFSVARGEVVVVAGGSGCGKSTLLKNIIGLARPWEGQVLVNGVDVHRAGPAQLAEFRRGIGVLFQSGALLGSLTLGENVALPLQDHTDLSQAEIDLVVRMKLGLVGLAGYQNHLPSELSGGMQKRAGLARAMALDPMVLFFDEPSAGLDPVTSAELDRLIIKLNRALGATMLIVTHELDSIFSIAHRVVLLDKSVKGIIAMGPPRDLADNPGDPIVSAFFHRRPRE